MKTLIQTLFFGSKRKVVRRARRNGIEAGQIAKIGKLGQTLVVMSR